MSDKMDSEPGTAIVIGASGGIGHSLVKKLSQNPAITKIYAFSRQDSVFTSPKVSCHFIDFDDEPSIAKAAKLISQPHLIGQLFITTGILHEAQLLPEKSLQELSAEKFQRLFTINTIGPALVAKHFIPLLPRTCSTTISVLSARVGSISDNRLGGWYSYRASKAALNMVVKNLSIELKRRCPNATIVAIHPGTVDSQLSKPFQRNVSSTQLFSADEAADHLLALVAMLTAEASGKFFAWNGELIDY